MPIETSGSVWWRIVLFGEETDCISNGLKVKVVTLLGQTFNSKRNHFVIAKEKIINSNPKKRCI